MDYMQIAIEEANRGIHAGHGGQFGAVIVQGRACGGPGATSVMRDQDATMHGEIAAIRDASGALGSVDLSGCALYTTAAPCPMCLGASLWANIDTIYYGCTREDMEDIGFRDNAFYQIITNPGEKASQLGRARCLELFKPYQQMDRIMY
jgi:guanine deaminase